MIFRNTIATSLQAGDYIAFPRDQKLKNLPLLDEIPFGSCQIFVTRLNS